MERNYATETHEVYLPTNLTLNLQILIEASKRHDCLPNKVMHVQLFEMIDYGVCIRIT